MKKLALAFLSASLTLVTVTSQAGTKTYTVSFTNPTGFTMTGNVIPNNSATHIECSGDCTSLPPNGNAIYKISSNELSFPWGPFAATFTNSRSSTYCDSAIEATTIEYQISTESSATDPSFSINVGEGLLPSGLYGNLSATTKCAS